MKNLSLVGYADTSHLFNPYKCRSQTGYVFTFNGTLFLGSLKKLTLVATSSNHSKILALHETCQECIWLHSVIHHIQNTCRISSSSGIPTVIYEDNVACIAKLRG